MAALHGMNRALLFTFFFTFTNSAFAGFVELQAIDLGWYRSTGIHNEDNTNTLTGHILSSGPGFFSGNEKSKP